jgi:hypothetical protein
VVRRLASMCSRCDMVIILPVQERLSTEHM